jgi:ATPase subunit of ABC transporter with duplicated ATPase domains
MHKPIQLKNLCFRVAHQTCFEGFSAQISYGSKIGIIGRNGSGKSCLLKILAQEIKEYSGDAYLPPDAVFGFIPQAIDIYASLSGGQQLNKKLSAELSKGPNILLLDEPTNHLDQKNRKALFRMLKAFPHTLVIATHDEELLSTCVDTVWHIDQQKIRVFNGHYDDYLREQEMAKASLEHSLLLLTRQKKDTHKSLMKEQVRAKKSKEKGKKSITERKWPTIVSSAKAQRAEMTSGRKKAEIADKKQTIIDQLSDIYIPEIIVPKFSITKAELGSSAVVSIRNGSIGYVNEQPIVSEINFSLTPSDRIAISGDNGSGKSTFIKSILGLNNIITEGEFRLPKNADIGYLDQHYKTLSPNKSVFDTIAELKPQWSSAEIRRHLVDFLFRKNEEVTKMVSHLSGGELARLSLAKIAAQTPKLLILDEITNNIDLETRRHIIQVLNDYPGALIIICHESEFLKQLNLTRAYKIADKRMYSIAIEN